MLASFGAFAARRPNARLVDALIWTLVIANWGAVIWQGKYWPYHWTPMIGFVAIFAGISVSQIATQVARRWSKGREITTSWSNTGTSLGIDNRGMPTRLFGAAWFFPRRAAQFSWRRAARFSWRRAARYVFPALVAGGLAIVAVPVDARYAMRLWRDAALVATGRKSLDDFRAPFECGAVDAGILREVVKYVRSHTRPGDKLLVWGYETVINFLADRRAPSRFAVDRILCLDEFPRRAAWREEFMASLRSTPPAYILVVDDDGGAMWRDSNIELARFDDFQKLVAREYVEEAPIECFHIYRRKAGNVIAEGSGDAVRR
jgi:hypothetical protein